MLASSLVNMAAGKLLEILITKKHAAESMLIDISVVC